MAAEIIIRLSLRIGITIIIRITSKAESSWAHFEPVLKGHASLGYATDGDVTLIGYTTDGDLTLIGDSTDGAVTLIGYSTDGAVTLIWYLIDGDVTLIGD